jgi:endonuclease YncB( thermonuclease family)
MHVIIRASQPPPGREQAGESRSWTEAACRWARHRLEELVSSPQVRIELVECAAGHRDRYGRLCGILYADARDVAPTMIREGLAPYVCQASHCPHCQAWCTQ